MDKDVLKIIDKVSGAGYEVVVVGGAVRDVLGGIDVKDWDLATSAKPEEILKIFPDAFYNNKFGTVGIPKGKLETRNSKFETRGPAQSDVVEVTTYRTEKSYSDSRHPDEVVWGKTLEEDLKRRDFTVNAIGLRQVPRDQRPFDKSRGKPETRTLKIDGQDWEVVDLFNGQEDLKNKIIRAVGDANARFGEDALRMLRAIRFAATLNFEIEPETKKAISENAGSITKISGERVREEIFKIIDSENCDKGFFLARDVGLIKYIMPELAECFSVEQKSPKRHHVYDVGTHCVMSMKHCPSKDIITRFAALLHDVGKAKVADVTGEGVRTFYNHEVVGARIANKISDRLHLSAKEKDKVFKLVRWHQFSVGEDQTDKAIRRFIKNVGLEFVEDMMDLRIGDRLGGGLEEPESWRLKLFRKRIKEVLTKPFTVADLKVDGRDVMTTLKIKPGPKVGEILNKLFEEVADDAKKNNPEYLVGRIKELES